MTVNKKSYADWSRQMNVAGNSVHPHADLTATPWGGRLGAAEGGNLVVPLRSTPVLGRAESHPSHDNAM